MIDRRQLIQSFAAGAALGALGPALAATPASPLRTRPIPSTGQLLPVLGVGTNNYSPKTPEERASRKAVLQQLTALGASVIDTAPMYGESEATIGELLEEIGNRPAAFLATKVTAQSGTRAEGEAMLQRSFERLRTGFVDLVQSHNLIGASVTLPLLAEWKQQGRIRYIGITTSRDEQYPEMLQLMRRETLDFVQVDYSLANRDAAADLLPLALERKQAVLINLPFGGRRDGNLFGRVRGIRLPDFAREFEITSWGQFFLKYVLSHPAVTCAIPGMTRVQNLEDNIGAARGALPDADARLEMERFWDRQVANQQ